MKGRAIGWTPYQLAWIAARRTEPRRETHAAFVARFGRAEVTLAALNALCKRRGWMTGRTGRIEPGATPPNKGRKGFRAPGSEKGWFRPGARQGRAAAVHQPIGAERLSKEGYLQRKVNEDLPFQRRWRGVHQINWEAENGPTPPGHVLKCLDGDRTNTRADNWVAVPRALLPRLNGRFGRDYDAAPAELKPTILAVAQLEHAAATAGRRAEPESKS